MMVKLNPDDLPPGRHRDAVNQALAEGVDTSAAEQLLGRKVKNRPEEDLQCLCISTARTWPMRTLLNNAWPKAVRNTSLAEWLYHIPNGGYRNKVEANRFKAMGVMPGVWDLFLMLPTTKYPGLYLELKAGDNDLTENQINFGARAAWVGWGLAEIRSLREFNEAIERHLIDAEMFHVEL